MTLLPIYEQEDGRKNGDGMIAFSTLSSEYRGNRRATYYIPTILH